MKLKCMEIAKAFGLKEVKTVGKESLFQCPNHDDRIASLSVSPEKNVWLCGPCGKSGGAWAFAFFLLQAEKTADVVKWLIGKEIMSEPEKTKYTFVCSYTYRDPEGKEYLQVRRFKSSGGSKTFSQYHKENGEWVAGANGVTLYPYRINEWKDKPVVYVVEGERDADNLWLWGIPATTNAMGAGKWKPEYAEHFKDKRVIIFPDNDEAGKRHAHDVVVSLLPVAIGVKVVHLPGLPPKGDFTDWVTKCDGNKIKLADVVKKSEYATHMDAKWEVKNLIRRANHDISDVFEKVKPDYDAAWEWMKSRQDLWDDIKSAEAKLDESCASGDDPAIIKARCISWKESFKKAITEFILEREKNVKN